MKPISLPWEKERFRLWSLLELLELNAQEFALISERYQSILVQIRTFMGIHGPMSVPDDVSRTNLCAVLEVIAKKCKKIGARGPMDAGNRAKQTVQSGAPWVVIDTAVQSSATVFFDEMASWKAFMMNSEQAAFFQKKAKSFFGKLPIARFASVSADMDSACECFALKCYPATVYHSMRICEAIALSVAKYFGHTFSTPPTRGETGFGPYCNTIYSHTDSRAKIEALGDKGPFFKEVHASLVAYKDAWRNPISHIDYQHINPECSDAAAMRVLEATKNLLVIVSSQMDETGTFI